VTGLRAEDIVRPLWLAHLKYLYPFILLVLIMLSLKMFVLFPGVMREAFRIYSEILSVLERSLSS